MREHELVIDGRRIWYAVAGEGGAKPPLVCVPGGPGMPHDYLEPLAALAAAGRPVVFYDALGSGRSERREGFAWTVDVYQRELAVLLATLGLARYHLLGHSAASFVVYPHACARPPGLAGLVLAGCPSSIPDIQASSRRLLGLAPDELVRFESAERYERPRDREHVAIHDRYARKHVYRVRPTPRSFQEGSRLLNGDAYRAMKGGLVLYTTELAAWDVTAELGNITARTLITCGAYDVLTPDLCEGIRARIPRCELEVFAASGHMPHVDEPDAFVARVARFLDDCDATSAGS